MALTGVTISLQAAHRNNKNVKRLTLSNRKGDLGKTISHRETFFQ
jgi:hypothetical protein